jgi:hypothetical protein
MYAELTTAQLRAIDTADLQALGSTLIDALTTAQVAALTSAQINALNSDQIAELDTDDIRALSASQMVGFASSAGIVSWSTDQIQALTTQQLAALSTAQIQWLETDDIVALTTDQVVGFKLGQIQAFTTDQIEAFQTEDLKALTATQSAAFTSAQLNAMNNEQISALVNASPIVLDLDGNGVRTVAAADGVHFDLLGNGRAERVGWVDGVDGLLAIDLDGDGRIGDGRELFGVGTRLADGQRAGDGYQALAQHDSNADGRIDARDERFQDLRVWVDADRDGQTAAGELRGLVDLGIAGLNLEHVKSDRVDQGNLVGLVSDYSMADGQVREMADVWFAKDRGSAEQAPTLSDLLVQPAESAPATGIVPAPAPVAASLPGAAVVTPPDDELRQAGPLV